MSGLINERTGQPITLRTRHAGLLTSADLNARAAEVAACAECDGSGTNDIVNASGTKVASIACVNCGGTGAQL
jgi:DnaJ-class molecular chaperone